MNISLIQMRLIKERMCIDRLGKMHRISLVIIIKGNLLVIEIMIKIRRGRVTVVVGFTLIAKRIFITIVRIKDIKIVTIIINLTQLVRLQLPRTN